jgi:hypothetical protein
MPASKVPFPGASKHMDRGGLNLGRLGDSNERLPSLG